MIDISSQRVLLHHPCDSGQAWLLQAFVDSLDKKEASKVHSTLLPVVAKSANDPAPEVREANMAVLVSFALKTGNMQALLDKVRLIVDDLQERSNSIEVNARIHWGDNAHN